MCCSLTVSQQCRAFEAHEYFGEINAYEPTLSVVWVKVCKWGAYRKKAKCIAGCLIFIYLFLPFWSCKSGGSEWRWCSGRKLWSVWWADQSAASMCTIPGRCFHLLTKKLNVRKQIRAILSSTFLFHALILFFIETVLQLWRSPW